MRSFRNYRIAIKEETTFLVQLNFSLVLLEYNQNRLIRITDIKAVFFTDDAGNCDLQNLQNICIDFGNL